MLMPEVLPWIEQRHDLMAVRIHAGEISSFVPVAAAARPSQVNQITGTAMLPGNNVLHVKWPRELDPFGESAVPAPALGPVANPLAQLGQHQAELALASCSRALI